MTANPIHEHERREDRAARTAAGEVERAIACRHYFAPGASACVYCGEDSP